MLTSNFNKQLLITFFILVTLPQYSLAKKYEKGYQADWCKGKGVTEYVLPDKTRVDCLTDTHAIEFDFAKKWAEAIGQALYYSFQTGKRGGVVLILKGKNDYKHWIKLNSVIDHYQLPIDTWKIQDE